MRTIYKTLLDSFDKCDRYGYLKYFFLGAGVEADIRKPELAIGSCIHKGVETIWKTGLREHGIIAALEEYADEAKDMFAEGVPETDRENIRKEHKMVIEAVLTLWFLVRYPKLIEEYSFHNSEYRVITPLTDKLQLLAIPDAILQSRADGRWLNWSLKTEKSHNRIKHPSALIDTGGLTESISAAMTVGEGNIRNISGTLMEYLVVGTMAESEPIIWHPAVRGWRKPSPLGGFDYAWRWKFPNPDYDPMGPKSAQKNPKEMSLKKKDGWERFEAINYLGGIFGWVTDLVARRFIPYALDPVDELIMVPHSYTRTTTAINEFLEEAIAEQTRVTENAEAIANGQLTLAVAFPKRRGNCLRYGEQYRCEMWEICHNGAGVDPLNHGYRHRLTSAEREARRKAKV